MQKNLCYAPWNGMLVEKRIFFFACIPDTDLLYCLYIDLI